MTSKRRRGYFSPEQERIRKPWNKEVALNRKNGRSCNSQFQGAIIAVFEYFQLEKEENGPIRSVNAVAKNVKLNVCKETLRKIIYGLGFKYVPRDGRTYLLKCPAIVEKRRKFLIEFRRALDEGKHIVTLDETWEFQYGTGKIRDWQDGKNDKEDVNVDSMTKEMLSEATETMAKKSPMFNVRRKLFTSSPSSSNKNELEEKQCDLNISTAASQSQSYLTCESQEVDNDLGFDQPIFFSEDISDVESDPVCVSQDTNLDLSLMEIMSQEGISFNSNDKSAGQPVDQTVSNESIQLLDLKPSFMALTYLSDSGDKEIKNSLKNKVTSSDLKRLNPNIWLNDKIVDAYFELIQNRDPLIQISKFPSGDKKRFPADRRNTQCTAIAAYAIVNLMQPGIKITEILLDQILIQGDQFYMKCKNINQVKYSQLQPEDLLCIPININGREMTLEIDQCGEGEYTENLEMNVLNAVNNSIDMYQQDTKQFGFLFIGNGRTLSFGRMLSTDSSFILFNSHNVDRFNQLPTAYGKEGKARLFKCFSTDALVKLILKGHAKTRMPWQIYRVQCI
ncbi:hypothetical protein HCN44_000829 [Aphidius gifuensis]|uniref:Uncharacterized protein n=1 Tax=Aphidius gifuensis TaxID=684658 RepID=A0A835CPU2_APHGI|nr:hypothetical protein HCN44_000829 [Aphidius gifuensis]